MKLSVNKAVVLTIELDENYQTGSLYRAIHNHPDLTLVEIHHPFSIDSAEWMKLSTVIQAIVDIELGNRYLIERGTDYFFIQLNRPTA